MTPCTLLLAWLRPAAAGAVGAALLVVGCSKDKPEVPANTVVAAPASADVPAGADAAAAAEPVPAADPAAPSEGLQKSEELRFLEATAGLLCFERENKRAAKDKERAKLLSAHGFGGKDGDQRYVEYSIRGNQDKAWGARMQERIKAEVESVCPSKK